METLNIRQGGVTNKKRQEIKQEGYNEGYNAGHAAGVASVGVRYSVVHHSAISRSYVDLPVAVNAGDVVVIMASGGNGYTGLQSGPGQMIDSTYFAPMGGGDAYLATANGTITLRYSFSQAAGGPQIGYYVVIRFYKG